MVIFIELVQYAKNLGGNSRKNLVEHQIIKMIRKFDSIICPFFAPYSQDNAFSLLHGPIQQFYTLAFTKFFLCKLILVNHCSTCMSFMVRHLSVFFKLRSIK